MQHLTIGLMAHVDCGKTTLAEALLFRTGEIRQLGRVDHGNSWLDTNTIERGRGITIFSHQASFPLSADKTAELLDTPGHVDFSAEMERMPIDNGYPSTLLSDVAEVQERINSTESGSITSFQAVFIPADDMNDEGHEDALINKVTQGEYPPGSVRLLPPE